MLSSLLKEIENASIHEAYLLKTEYPTFFLSAICLYKEIRKQKKEYSFLGSSVLKYNTVFMCLRSHGVNFALYVSLNFWGSGITF